jgi:hypothetical protein
MALLWLRDNDPPRRRSRSVRRLGRLRITELATGRSPSDDSADRRPTTPDPAAGAPPAERSQDGR